jgi:hypothetical protein
MIHKKHRAELLVSIFLFFLFTVALAAQSSENYTLKKWAINTGGGSSSSSNYALQDAVGQSSAVGTMTSTDYGAASGFWGEGGMETGIEDKEGDTNIPQTFKLHQNYPNPFNPETCIAFDLPWKAEVVVTIYDLQGKKVNCILQGTQETGTHTVMWRGKDFYGNTVSSGLYFYRIMVSPLNAESKTMVKVGKMIFMK